MFFRLIHRSIFILGLVAAIQLLWGLFGVLFPSTYAQVNNTLMPNDGRVVTTDIGGFEVALNQEILDYEIDESDLQDTYDSIENLSVGERVKQQLKFITKASKIRDNQLDVIQASLDSHK